MNLQAKKKSASVFEKNSNKSGELSACQSAGYWLCFSVSSDLFQDLSQLQETWLTEGEKCLQADFSVSLSLSVSFCCWVCVCFLCDDVHHDSGDVEVAAAALVKAGPVKPNKVSFFSFFLLTLFGCCLCVVWEAQTFWCNTHAHKPYNTAKGGKKKKKKKEVWARENTDGTLLALSMSYFGHVGMQRACQPAANANKQAIWLVSLKGT